MKVCVTGGAGYIGSHLVSALVTKGHEVTVVDSMDNGDFFHPLARFYSHDIREINQIEEDLQGTEVFFHLAANKQARSFDCYDMVSVNVAGTAAVLETAKTVGARRLVFSSSSAVYSPAFYVGQKISEEHFFKPINFYGMSKKMGEDLCEMMSDDQFDTVSLRYFNVWGGEHSKHNAVKSVMEIFEEKKAKGEPLVIYGDGSSVRDYVHVNDVVNANLLAANHPSNQGPRVFNICTGQATTVLEVARKVCGEDYPIVYTPAGDNEVEYSVGDYIRASTLLKWTPTIYYK